MPPMLSYSHRLKSGQITCYLNRTYHVLTTIQRTALADDTRPRVACCCFKDCSKQDLTHDGSQRFPESQCFSLSQQCAHPYLHCISNRQTWTYCDPCPDAQ